MEPQHIIITIFGLILLIVIVLIYSGHPCNDTCEDMIDLSIIENMNNSSKENHVYKENCNCNKHKLLTHVEHYSDNSFQPDYAWLSQNNLMPWWNSTRHTRNMSYDLRGDVPIIPTYIGPFNSSPLI
jgi:hypothetical protein